MKKYSCARCGKGRVRYRTPSPFKVMAAEKAKRDKIMPRSETLTVRPLANSRKK